MDGVAADDAAERNRPLIGLPALLGGIERNRDRRRDFERAGHAQTVEHRAGLLQRARRAREQRIGDVVIKARLHDQHADAFEVARFRGRVAAWLGHISLRLSQERSRACLPLRRFKQSCRIARHQVDFEIDDVAGGERA